MNTKAVSCASCAKTFSVALLHNGFNNSEFLYCDTCHRVAILNFYSRRSNLLLQLADMSGGVLWSWRNSIEANRDIEMRLSPCQCGGHFSFQAAPHCPICRAALNLQDVLRQLNVRQGWNNGWRGIYCLVVEGGIVEDPFVDDFDPPR
jgi:hypothetical protein